MTLDDVPGQMGRLVDAFDWARTPLGPRSQWHTSLRTIVSTLLHSRHPMFLWWGPELIQVYNDAYMRSLGPEKHPAALGSPGRETWREIWPIIGPQIEDVMLRGKPSWSVDALVPIVRNGRVEDVYWTYGYSPVADDAGAIGGTLVVCTETTTQVLGLRRQQIIQAVSEALEEVDQISGLPLRFVQVLATYRREFPFVLAYDRSADGAPHVRAAHGVGGDAAIAIATRLEGPPPDTGLVVELPGGARAFVLPARSASVGREDVAFGLSDHLPFDAAHRGFLTQLRGQLDHAFARIAAVEARGAAERERNDLLMHAPLAAAVLSGPEHTFVLANARYLEIVGRTHVVGQAYLEAFPELTDTPLPGILDRVYRTGEPYVTEELSVPLDRTGSGSVQECFYRFNLEPVRDVAGAIVGLLAIAVDITEQVRARKTLERAEVEREALLEQLRASSQAKDEFLAMLSHELRNPLSPIVTAIELMKLDHREFEERLPVVERQVGHVVRLVDDLIDVSRFRRGQLELVRERVELRAILERALETASPLLERAGHRVAVDVPTHGLAVHADPLRLTQVFSNLLTNAAKYTPEAGNIHVAAMREGEDVVCRVVDDGVGIDPSDAERLFEPFVQIGQDSARSSGGLGLGLAIVKVLTEKHGGVVTVASQGRDAGSTFTVRLPLASGAVQSNEPLQAEVRATPARKRILVVDDNEDAADMMVVLLERLGHDVRGTYDSAAALQLAVAMQPDVAILDIGMPVMDGYELARRIGEQPELARTQLIALTGYGQPEDRARSEHAGFRAHLVKPVSMDALVQAIDADGR